METFNATRNLSIYEIKSFGALEELYKQYPLCLLYDGNNLYAWKMDEMTYEEAIFMLLESKRSIANCKSFGLEVKDGGFELTPNIPKDKELTDKLLKILRKKVLFT